MGQDAQRDVEAVWAVLGDAEPADAGLSWSARYRAHLARIETGAPVALAEVVRDLHRRGFELSFGERKMLEHARWVLVQKLANDLRIPAAVAEERIARALG